MSEDPIQNTDVAEPAPDLDPEKPSGKKPKGGKLRGLDLMRAEMARAAQQPEPDEKPTTLAPELRAAIAHDRAGERVFDGDEPAPRSLPFRVGARLRYVGPHRLLHGWEGNEVLGPGRVVTVVEMIAQYSVFMLERASMRVLIRPEDRRDWVELP